VIGLGGALLVTIDIKGWIVNGVGFDFVRVMDFAWILGSRGWDGGTMGDDWEPGGAGDGGE
jgi:hypothetical protein